MIVKNKIIPAAALVLFAGIALYYYTTNRITIAGDPCTVPLARKLAAAYTKKTGVNVNIQSAGCATGIHKAISGEADIGVSTHEVNPKAVPEDATVKVIAKAPTVILVNKSNPVNNLSIRQVKDILAGKIGNWKDVGGKDMDIQNVLLQPCTTSIFSKKTAPFGASIKKIFPETKGDPVEGTNILVEENEGALGLQIYGYESESVKVLTIDGELPNMADFPGKYGYYQDYSVIIDGKPEGNIKAFLDFAMSDEGREIIASMKHIGVKN